jgi:membrane protein DedA with SNARE-associated domain
VTLFTLSEAVAFAMAGMAFGVTAGFVVGTIFGRASIVAEGKKC